MNLLKYMIWLVAAMLLTACGGGGGSSGTSSGAAVVTTTPTLTLELRDEAGQPTSAISPAGFTTLVATLKNPDGTVIPQKVLDVKADETQLKFSDGSSMLTDSTGTAMLKVARASITAIGAGKLTVTYVPATTGTTTATAPQTVTAVIGYQLGTLNVTLSNLNLGVSALPAYGNRNVSVQVSLNGVAPTTPVIVSFSATCGTVEPATASSNSNGIASVTYKAYNSTLANDQGCSGTTVNISATSSGASAVSGSLNVAVAPATNLQFVSTTPAVIYLVGSGGTTQSVVKFKLINASGAPLQGQDVRLSLLNSPTGVTLNTVGKTDPVVVSTDLAGEVSVPVFSGTVPTPVLVGATLVSNPLVTTSSGILTVASGRAVQSRLSLSSSIFAIEGFNIDGNTSKITLSVADRQGNPVIDGTVVNFVTEGGVMIPPSCVIQGGTSQCSVDLRSGAPRPANGRVSVLAYLQGEEDFVDANFNNVYDPGEAFTDLGNAFRDDNENGVFDTGEFSVPRAGSVSTGNGCPGYLGRPGSCDGVWGATDVRIQSNFIFSTSQAVITGTLSPTIAIQGSTDKAVPGISLVIADLNGNSMPTGSTIAASVVDNTKFAPAVIDPLSPAAAPTYPTCALNDIAPTVVPNTLVPLPAFVSLSGCVSGDQVRVTVTAVPTGTVTTRIFTIP